MRPQAMVSVIGSFRSSEENTTPATGTPSKPKDVEIVGKPFMTIRVAQKQKAVAMGPL